MRSSHNSAHSCLDTSMDGNTDPCPAVKILLIFCENSFSNICLEKKKWNIVFFFSLMTKQKLKTLTNVWEDLYSPLFRCCLVSPHVLTCLWTEYMAAHQGWERWCWSYHRWGEAELEPSYWTGGSEHIRPVGVHMHISVRTLYVCVCGHPHSRVLVWGHWWCLKINNIPAVFNIPASHTLLLTASGIRLPLVLLEESPQSPTVLLTQASCPQLAHHLAGQIFYFPVVACLLF